MSPISEGAQHTHKRLSPALWGRQVLTLNCLCHATHTQSLGLLNLSTSVNCDDKIQKPNATERKGVHPFGFSPLCASVYRCLTALQLYDFGNTSIGEGKTIKLSEKKEREGKVKAVSQKENNNKTRESRNGQKSTSKSIEIRWKGKRKIHPQHE